MSNKQIAVFDPATCPMCNILEPGCESRANRLPDRRIGCGICGRYSRDYDQRTLKEPYPIRKLLAYLTSSDSVDGPAFTVVAVDRPVQAAGFAAEQHSLSDFAAVVIHLASSDGVTIAIKYNDSDKLAKLLQLGTKVSEFICPENLPVGCGKAVADLFGSGLVPRLTHDNGQNHRILFTCNSLNPDLVIAEIIWIES